MSQRFYHSVRFKLLLVSLTLLSIPWAGYQFILETEQFLRDAQQTNLRSHAQAMARLLENQVDTFNAYKLPGKAYRQNSLYLHQWQQAPVVDGYRDEWESYGQHFTHYALPDRQLNIKIALGSKGHFAYLLLDVGDSSTHYGQQGDRVDISLGNDNQLHRLYIQPEAPGWVVAKTPERIETRVRGEWQETATGYTLELRIPLNLLGARMAIAVTDSGSQQRLQTSRLFPTRQVAPIVRASATLQTLLKDITPAFSRAWVVNHEALVLARSGSLEASQVFSADSEQLPWLVQELILAVLPQQTDSDFSLHAQRSRLNLSMVEDALAGRASGSRRYDQAQETVIVSTAVPVRSTQGIVGAVVLEQTTNAILSIQNLALQRLFVVTLTFFVITSLGLLLFASLLTTRIHRLRKQMDQAVSHDGRIIGDIPPNKAHDEIGELGRGLAAVLKRLSEYNHYLEAMASRLAHELRTPLSVVRTSLDNAAQSNDTQAQQNYIARAHDGAERLDLILQRLREATRLEQSLEQAEFVDFDLVELLQYQTDAFHSLWPSLDIQLDNPLKTLSTHAVPDLLCQALEKLVGNAVDFHTPDTRIVIRLRSDKDKIDLVVINQGPSLPDNIDLFQSMTSARTGRSDEPHLGLGLYLVRLIAEFHHGNAYAMDTGNGVCMGMQWTHKD